MEIISKEQAVENGQKHYFTGIPCKNGHCDKRYVNTDICYACKREQIKRDYDNHPERVTNTNKKSRKKHSDKHNKKSKEWVEKNPIKRKAITAKYRETHREDLREYSTEYQKRKRKDPSYRISKNISKALWHWMKGGKAFRHWEDIVGYTVKDLIEHLEKKFRDGMTWENYGPFWHVDHIKPLSLCDSLEEAWALSNLQPLLKEENLSKNNRFIG